MLRLVDSAGASRVREDAASFDSDSPKRLPQVTSSEWLEARFPAMRGKFDVQSMGEEKPICFDRSEGCWESNRRVEISVQ